MFRSEKKRLKKMLARDIVCLICIIVVIMMSMLSFAFLFINPIASLVFFGICIPFVPYVVYSFVTSKKEERKNTFIPISFTFENDMDFNDLVDNLTNEATTENTLQISENRWFFYYINKRFKTRILLYKTDKFNKQEFDAAKRNINKRANKWFEFPQWVSFEEGGRMMRYNIIFTDTLNKELNDYISQNAYHLLTRVEGIINIIFVKNKILIPPLLGCIIPLEISRYLKTLTFFEKLLSN